MASRFDDRLKIARDKKFQERVAMAALVHARQVLKEPKDTPHHKKRKEYAKELLEYAQYLSGGPFDTLFHLLAADGETDANTADGVLAERISSLWNDLTEE